MSLFRQMSSSKSSAIRKIGSSVENILPGKSDMDDDLESEAESTKLKNHRFSELSDAEQTQEHKNTITIQEPHELQCALKDNLPKEHFDTTDPILTSINCVERRDTTPNELKKKKSEKKKKQHLALL